MLFYLFFCFPERKCTQANLKYLIDESNWENVSDDDEDFTLVTSVNNFESSDNNIENDATAEPTNQIKLLLQKNFIKLTNKIVNRQQNQSLTKFRREKHFHPPNTEWTHKIENEDIVPKTPINYFMECLSDDIFELMIFL